MSRQRTEFISQHHNHFLYFRTEKIYNFFLRWTPERQFNALIDDDDNIVTNASDQPTCQGFVRLANDDPELNDDYDHSSEKNDDKSKKKSHYLKRQNTLLKEWEVKEKR